MWLYENMFYSFMHLSRERERVRRNDAFENILMRQYKVQGYF
jgi:hypothetical protein